MRVYIINGRATRNKIDDRSHQGSLMGYEATTGVILYWKPDQTFIIHRAHHVWFDEYRKNLGVLHISMPYGSPAELRIDYVVMFFTFYGMEQNLHTNISKYGV